MNQLTMKQVLLIQALIRQKIDAVRLDPNRDSAHLVELGDVLEVIEADLIDRGFEPETA